MEAADTVYECKARGIFRRHSQKPLAGDQVVIVPAEDGTATIDEVLLPRKNQLVRPPVANIDQLIITASTCDPVPNPLIIDKMTALAVHKNIQPVVVITKSDLDDRAWLKEIYDLAQIRCVLFSAVSGEGAGEMKELLEKENFRPFRELRRREIFFAQPPVRRLAAGNRRYQPKAGTGPAYHPSGGAF